jgi:iron complex outermembrane receptor protein
LQVDYAVSDDWLLFASYNRGYKAFNYNAGFAGAAGVADVRFDGEFLNAYEIGTKLDFWEHRARFNVSAFYYDYNDYQAFDQRGPQFILSNTDASIYGAEAEFAVSPGYGINLQAGVALLDTDVEDIPIGGQLLDREAPQSPDLTFNFFISKDFQLGAGTVRLSFDGAYTDAYFSQLTNAPVTLVDSNWLLNTRLSFTSKDERWEAAIFARNLLDEERQVYAFDITFPGNGLVEQTYAPPRWVGGQIRYNF